MSDAVRVAVMEIRTTAYRAYVAAGASSGEAEAVGAAAARAEVLIGGGVRLAVAGLDRVPRERLGARVVEGTPDRLDDPADRAPLLAARLALDWLAATGRPVAVPGLPWDDALGGALPDGVAAVGPASGVAAVDGGLARFDGTGGTGLEPVDGVLFAHAAPTVAVDLIDAATAAERVRLAGARGVAVDAAAWTALDVAAARYLVPEAG